MSAPAEGARFLLVVDDADEWDMDVPAAVVVSGRDYLTDRSWASSRRTRVFNLCRSHGYQTVGYYVSLLAAARGHRPQPSVATMQELHSGSHLRLATEELDDLIQRSLRPIESDAFELSVYFGRNLARRYERLSRQLFNHFPQPLLRARFMRSGGRWWLRSLRSLALRDVPASHRDFLADSIVRHFGRREGRRPRRAMRHDLAMLVKPDDPEAPSNEGALRRFVRAGEALGIAVHRIDRHDVGRIAEHDALFIRETTHVDHYTYRIASRAAAEGLVVIDDPESIIRCTNKVFLEELLARLDVPRPKTLVLHAGNADRAGQELGFPCVLKKPDSAFSVGVVKAEDEATLRRLLGELLAESELVVAQEYVSTDFDWRVGVLDGSVLYTCRYLMAKGHWQIVNHAMRAASKRYGEVEAIPVEKAPRALLATALQAANAMGNGLYGVDVKEVGGRFLVIEVNDNPNIDSGVEDAVLGDELYERVMRVFLERIEQRGATSARRLSPESARRTGS